MININALIERTRMLEAIENLHIIPCYDKNGNDIREDVRCQFLGTALKVEPKCIMDEAIPHSYLSQYWCECGWQLGNYNSVKFCADCGRKINWKKELDG